MRPYHCDPLIFGNPIKLTVTPSDPSPVEPNLFVLSPLLPEGWLGRAPDTLGPDVCLATDFRPQAGEMLLNVASGSVSLNTSSAVLSPKQNKYFFAGFSNETIYSCEMQKTSSNNDVDRCADLHPEKARLNFYLLVMNGVRVLFTKTLAFNTILTIRAVLFYTSPVEPNLFVLSPLLPEERPGPDVCLATGFRPQGGQMVLKVQNSSDTRSTGGAALSLKEKTYFFAGFSSERIDSCELHKTVAQRKEPDLSHCKKPDDSIPPSPPAETDKDCGDLRPEKARLNFYLLVMNGVRVLFTKTLAFNTILTIRAVLF
ncbi:uncharacterized protein [Trachinotus anak]|uniref:uncharacterized protein n=1 Tax=Trachinotus anak TaxID=443729 RepID=UPI0039F1FC1E